MGWGWAPERQCEQAERAGRQRGLAVGGEDREDWKESREGWEVGTRRQGEGAAQR